ncbi:MAG: hypothetical protein R3A48_04830 [Polyangiales bacterium]
MNMWTEAKEVIGFHGTVVPGRSPGLHAVVAVDSRRRLVDAHGLHDELVIGAEGALPGDATRIGPWPFVDGHAVITAHVPLLRRVRRQHFSRLPERPALKRFLDALDAPEAMREARAEALGSTHVVAWYSSREDIDALRLLLREIASADLESALTRGGDLFIQQSAWALQRAAIEPRDDLRAIAALEIAGFDDDELRELTEELVRELTPVKRNAMYKRCLSELRALKARQGTSPGAASEARAEVRQTSTLQRAG